MPSYHFKKKSNSTVHTAEANAEAVAAFEQEAVTFFEQFPFVFHAGTTSQRSANPKKDVCEDGRAVIHADDFAVRFSVNGDSQSGESFLYLLVNAPDDQMPRAAKVFRNCAEYHLPSWHVFDDMTSPSVRAFKGVYPDALSMALKEFFSTLGMELACNDGKLTEIPKPETFD
jgi:hypothetical protein